MKNLKVVLLILVIVSKFQAFGAANFGFGAPAVNRSNIETNIITSNAFEEVEKKTIALDNEQLDSELNIENRVKKEKRKSSGLGEDVTGGKRNKLSASTSISEYIEQLEAVNSLELKRKVENNQEKEEFEKFYSIYPKEIDASIKKLQALGYPYELAKLIIQYSESSSNEYEAYETLIYEQDFKREKTAHWTCNLTQLNNGDLVTSFNNEIKIWRRNYCSNEWDCIQVLEHTWVDSLIQLTNGDIISFSSGDMVTGSFGYGIKIWRLKSNGMWELKQTFEEKRGFKSIIQLNNGDLVSNSVGNIKVWRQDSKGSWFCLQILNYCDETFANIRAHYLTLELNNGDLVCASGNGHITIWSLKKNNKWHCSQDLASEMEIGSMTQLDNGDLAIAGRYIRIYSNKDKNWSCIQTLYESGYNSIIELVNGDLAFATRNNNGAIKIWRRLPNKNIIWLQTLKNGYNNSINSLVQLSNGDFVFCSSIDKIVTICRLNSDNIWECVQTLNKDYFDLVYSKGNDLFFNSRPWSIIDGRVITKGVIKIFRKPFANLFPANIHPKINPVFSLIEEVTTSELVEPVASFKIDRSSCCENFSSKCNKLYSFIKDNPYRIPVFAVLALLMKTSIADYETI